MVQVLQAVQLVCQACTIAESRLRHGSARSSSAQMRPAGHTGVSVEADTTAEATVAVVAAEDIEAAVAAVVATVLAAASFPAKKPLRKRMTSGCCP